MVRSALPDAGLEILDVEALSPPSNSLQRRLLLRIKHRLHPVVVEAPGLVEVDDGEPVDLSGSHVANTEEEPLGVLVRVEVTPHVQLIVPLSPGGGRGRGVPSNYCVYVCATGSGRGRDVPSNYCVYVCMCHWRWER